MIGVIKLDKEKEEIFMSLAQRMIFRGITEDELLKNFKYRKNKKFEDIKIALGKAHTFKYGRGKTETEIEMSALFLNDILLIKKEKIINEC